MMFSNPHYPVMPMPLYIKHSRSPKNYYTP